MGSLRGWSLFTSAAAPALLIGGWTVAARLQPKGFDPVKDTISALAADDAHQRWLMTAALAGVGVAHAGTALALRPAAAPGRVLLGVGGVATGLVAAFPLPEGDGSSRPHAIAAGTAFVSLGLWPALSWRRNPAAGQAPRPAPFRPAVAISAAGVLLGALGWFFCELGKDDGDRVGFTERVAAGSQALWPLVAVLLTRRSGRR
jgi:hypothetical membrane protein